ncbi:PDZ domain-containing protein [Nocardioides humilatus]|uniref:PDZ domain-containing protein n=1 Tax=Nocardioides humilatus TaxID=2607660 RepID=A0A5B1LJT0_9ACTN|nr:site-2 protease family protein [Nocardioides humilatus]KAA1420803.1 PDZ domain-containing protein [Nocardioides humilatus]
MDALQYTIGFLIFFVGILISIGLHEVGHMVPAKKFGGKVTQYFIGFGPTVRSWQVGETEYGVKAIPLGGYVKIVGMLPPGAEDLADDVSIGADGQQVTRIRKSNTGMFTQLISDARAAEWELVGPEDSERLFYKMAWWKKVVVMAGGPSVNILIAFFLFWALFAIHGNDNDELVTTTLDEVQACIVPPDEAGRVCTADEIKNQPTPAFKAGLKVGDRIVSFNGVDATSWTQVQQLIRDNGNRRATIVVERDGDLKTITTKTTVTPRIIDEDADPEPVGFLGVRPSTEPATGGPIYTVQQMGGMTVDVLHALVTLPAKVLDVGKAIVGLQDRDPQGPVSIVGGGRLAGEVASHDGTTVGEKVVFFTVLLAGFNLFIGMFNFIPLLPLDGGHIASALWEAVRRGLARVRGRPDPGYVDAAKLLPVAYVVASALLVMGVVLIVGDLVVPVHLES